MTQNTFSSTQRVFAQGAGRGEPLLSGADGGFSVTPPLALGGDAPRPFPGSGGGQEANYHGQSVSVNTNQLNDQEKREEQTTGLAGTKRGSNIIED